MMASEAVQQRVQRRLMEERARMEAKVTAQIDAERQALLERRREERRTAQPQEAPAPLDVDRILEENRRKLEEARGRGGGRGVAESGACALMLSRRRHGPPPQGLRVIDD